MLSSFLPGLRQLRVPLAAGALWLTVIALVVVLVDQGLPDSKVFDAVILAAEWAGVVPALGALSVAAYVVGVLVDLKKPAAFLFRDRREWDAGRQIVESTVGLELHAARERGVDSDQVLDVLPGLRAAWRQVRVDEANRLPLTEEQLRVTYVRRASATPPDYGLPWPDAWTWLRSQHSTIARAITSGADAQEEAVMVAHRDLHDHLDRDRAEGEFRRDIALPLALLLALTGVSLLDSGTPILSVVLIVAGLVAGAMLMRKGQELIDRYRIGTWMLMVDRRLPCRELDALRALQPLAGVESGK